MFKISAFIILHCLSLLIKNTINNSNKEAWIYIESKFNMLTLSQKFKNYPIHFYHQWIWYVNQNSWSTHVVAAEILVSVVQATNNAQKAATLILLMADFPKLNSYSNTRRFLYALGAQLTNGITTRFDVLLTYQKYISLVGMAYPLSWEESHCAGDISVDSTSPLCFCFKNNLFVWWWNIYVSHHKSLQI